MDNQLLKFLLPSHDGSIHASLQVSFAAIFIAAAVIVPLLVSRSARSECWARNLARLDARDAPATAYETADGLGAAVATPAERWADVLPSMLLVFGLLGTFIGLGLALTEAAGALAPGNDALGSLTSIMDSLGSKFKTSTWGILAFLGMKMWFMLHPYEEARMHWAAHQIADRAAQAAMRRRQQSEGDHQQLIGAISEAGGDVVAEHQQFAQLTDSYHTRSLEVLQKLVDWQAKDARQREQIAQRQLAALARLEEQLGTASKQREGLAARADILAEHGARQVEQNETQLVRMAELAAHSEATRFAMDSFVHGVSDNIATMARAADNMAVAAEAAGRASVDLGAVIGDFRTQMIAVLDTVKRDLKDTIDRMGGSFGDNMQAMSADLAKATDGIGSAISQLSGGVQDTLTMLHASNEESMVRQNKAQATFTASGQELMTAISMIEGSFKEMHARITSGLSAISTTGQQLRHFETHFKDSNERVTALVRSVEGLASATQNTGADLQAFVTLGADVRQLVTGMEMQGLAQSEALQRHLLQLDASERVASKVVSLTAAIAAFVASLQEQRDGKAEERAVASLERIEGGIATMASSLERLLPAADETQA